MPKYLLPHIYVIFCGLSIEQLPLITLTFNKGKLYGTMNCLGFQVKSASLVKHFTSEIEGVDLPIDSIRSSVARRLGL